jgi:plasmid stability protein
MADFIIHNFDPAVEEQLRARAQAHARSVEAEAAAILALAVEETRPPTVIHASPEMLAERERIMEKFMSGEWSAELEGFEEARAADRRESEELEKRWRT